MSLFAKELTLSLISRSNDQVSRFATVGKYGLVLSIQEDSEKATFEPPVVDFGNVATVVAAAHASRRLRGGRLDDTPGGIEDGIWRDRHCGSASVGGGAGEQDEQEYLPNG